MRISRLSDPLFVTGLALALLLMLLDRFALLPFGAGVADGAPTGLLLAWAIGHCDTLDGPVVNLARKALETGNVNHVLPWVRASDEAEIKAAFGQAFEVRKLGAQARELADRHFFETLVRIHRAGEGAPFTGLKAAGQDLGPAIPAADQALADGSVEKVVTLLTEELRQGVHRHFHAAIERRNFAVDDVKAGRRFVEAYVPYIHYVERLWQTIAGEAHGHHPEAAAHGHHPH